MIFDAIQFLDETSINKIAAGEVVERPASVVKELVENSLDAGATRIEVEIENGGLGRIRVIDDGRGMSAKDARMAVLRHATSKIRNSNDLLTVRSLGFRGEALPSIASVSRFALLSRLSEAEIGTQLAIEGGQAACVCEAGAGQGTVITVSDLFFNTPARLKFMKTPQTESSHINEVMIRMAISRPDVTFKLTNNNRNSLYTPGTGRLSDTLSSIYGPDIFRELIAVEFSAEGISLEGFLSKPSIRKSSRQWQTFTVNQRVIASRLINRAVDTAYQSLLPQGSNPLVALHISMPTALVDVNVHPQKAEVKFQDERLLFRTVQQALKDALVFPDTPAAAATTFEHRSFEQSGSQPAFFQESLSAGTYLSDPIETCDVGAFKSFPEATTTANPCMQYLQVIGQFAGCYIVATDGQDLFIIDQHAAHERLLFDKLAEKDTHQGVQTQLIPLCIDLDPLEVSAAERYSEALIGLGFQFDWVGPTSVRLLGLPSNIPTEEAGRLFRLMLSSALAIKKPDLAEFRAKWLETAACHMAVRAGQGLNKPQMQALLDELAESGRPYTCPHGRPVMIRLTTGDMARLFKRT